MDHGNVYQIGRHAYSLVASRLLLRGDLQKTVGVEEVGRKNLNRGLFPLSFKKTHLVIS